MCVRLSRHIQVDLIFRYLPHLPARALSTVIDLIRIAFFGYAIKLVWQFIQIIGDERMTTIKFPKGFVYYAVLLGFVLMFAALDPGRGRELAAGLLHPGAPRRIRRNGRLRAMLLLLGGFLLLMLIGLPVALAMAVSSLVYILVTGITPDVIAGAAHDRRRRELSAAGRAVLHPGRQPDEHRRRDRAHLQLRGRAGGLDARRARPRQHHRLGDLFRHVRHRHRRRRRARHHRDQGDEGSRLLHRVRRRRDGGLGDARADHPAVAAVRDLRHDGERLDRRAVPRRRDPRRGHDACS